MEIGMMFGYMSHVDIPLDGSLDRPGPGSRAYSFQAALRVPLTSGQDAIHPSRSAHSTSDRLPHLRIGRSPRLIAS
jgi:hypothetical protein